MLRAGGEVEDVLRIGVLGDVFPTPPLSHYAEFDPDTILHQLYGEDVNDTRLRGYANFVNHENFSVAASCRRHIIVSGSGRDPANICGVMISRLRPLGYKVAPILVLILSPPRVGRAPSLALPTHAAQRHAFTCNIHACRVEPKLGNQN